MMPVMRVRTSSRTRAGRTMVFMLHQMEQLEAEVDELDACERDHNASEAINEQVAPQEDGRAERSIFDPLQGQWDQEHDDQRIEDHRRENGGERTRQAHHIER